jgi:hypothetical protein
MLHGFLDLSATRERGGFGHGGVLVFQKSTMEIYREEGFARAEGAKSPESIAGSASQPIAARRR